MSFRACFMRASSFLILIVFLMTGCSRDHDIKPKAPFPPEIRPACNPVPDESIQFVQDIQVNDQILTPTFTQSTDEYAIQFGYPVREARVRVRVPNDQPDGVLVSSVSLRVNGKIVNRFESSEPLPLVIGSNEIVVDVEASVRALPYSEECLDAEEDGLVQLGEFAETEKQYIITVRRKLLDEYNEQTLAPAAAARDAGDRFGFSMARFERTLAIGAPYDDSNAAGIFSADGSENENNDSVDAGALYLYTLDGTSTWQPSLYVKAPNVGAGDLFGYAVAMQGEWLAVSAPREDSNASDATAASASGAKMTNDTATNSGAVYLYRRLGDDWEFHSYIKPPLNDLGVDGFDDGFGEGLAIKDGRLFVSAPREDSATNGSIEDNSVANAGAVFIYEFNASLGNWRYTTVVKSDYARQDDFFGHALVLHDDMLLVSAPGEDSSFRGISTDRVIIEDIDINNPSPREDQGRPDSGAVYLYEQGAGEFSWRAIFKSSNSDAGDGFGRSIAVGDERIIVGAPFEDGNGRAINRNMANNDRIDSGAAYVFRLENDRWIEHTYLKALNAAAGDRLGASLSLFGDDLLVGASRQDEFFNNNGAVYQFEYTGSVWSQTNLALFGESDDARFGRNVTLSADALVIGSHGFIDGSTGTALPNAGRTYVFQY